METKRSFVFDYHRKELGRQGIDSQLESNLIDNWNTRYLIGKVNEIWRRTPQMQAKGRFYNFNNRNSTGTQQLPFSQWTQHRDQNGLVYLSHPVTKEVKWLWSRHHDPKTNNDYLVNTITQERQWVTPQNAHLCPFVKPHQQHSNDHQQPHQKPHQQPPQQANMQQQQKHAPQRHSHQGHFPIRPNPNVHKQVNQMHVTNNNNIDNSTPLSKPGNSATAATPAGATTGGGAMPKHTYKVVKLGSSSSSSSTGGGGGGDGGQPEVNVKLAHDEVLMKVVETGRYYVFNKRTKASRWINQPSSSASIPSSNPPINKAGSQNSPSQRRNPNAVQTKSNDIKESEQAISEGISSISISKNMSSNSPAPANTGGQNQNGANSVPYPHYQQGQQSAHAHAQTQTQSHLPLSSPTASAGMNKAQNQNNATNNSNNTTASNTDGNDEFGKKISRLQALSDEVEQMTKAGKYNMVELRHGVEHRIDREETKQKLLQLGEFLTQQMLKVDDVETGGNAAVRAKRKQTINFILGLTDEVEQLNQKVKA